MFLIATTVIIFCLTVNAEDNFANSSTYDAGELLSKIFPSGVMQPRVLVKFDDHFDSQNGKVNFEIGHENSSLNDDDRSTHVQFGNFEQKPTENEFNNLSSNINQPDNKKKKRRRRKQRKQFLNQPGIWNGPVRPDPNFGLVPRPDQNFGPAPGPGQNFGIARPGQNFGPPPGLNQNFVINQFQSDFNGQHYRPIRRPQSSLASDTLVAVTEALTSIAHNDDYQCVARLICEAAAGGALGGSSILDSVSGLQPLLTLLSAYNGISSNPLFVFGRAAFLGMSSKSNPGSCRYAYPLCPTDPEQLVHYLNNHNGGFFRFFNAPQNGQQNVEQFYNQLSQNYGLYQPTPVNSPEFYGLLNSGINQNPTGQPNLYPSGNGYQQNYGFAYPYNQNHNNVNGLRFKNYDRFNENRNKEIWINKDEQKIEQRIQNKPVSLLNDKPVIDNSKWLFPGDDDRDEREFGVQYIDDEDFGLIDNRKGKTFKFPDTDSNYYSDNIKEYNKNKINFYATETIRAPKGISFPEDERNINDYDYNKNKYYASKYSNGASNYNYNSVNKDSNNIFKRINHKYNTYSDQQDQPGVTTVYVVRGNGDPNKPEIVKLLPGQTL